MRYDGTVSPILSQAISDGMKAYWATIPNKPNENNESEKQFKDETCM